MKARAARDNRGAAAVEFALVAGILFTLIFGTIQYGLYFWSLQSGAHAAREAARQAAVGSAATKVCTDFVNAVKTNARGEQDSTVTAKRTFFTDESLGTPGAPTIGGAVKIEVTFDSIDLGLPFVPFIDGGRVAEQAVARVENTETGFGNCP